MQRLKIFSTFQEALFLLTHPWVVLRERLIESKAAKSPFEQFARWYRSAQRSLTNEFPNAMCLSTVGRDGEADARLVLLKGFSDRGFVFYTNSYSAKGRQIAAEARVALTFYWGSLQRQVRVQGIAESVSKEEADAYFASRPRRSKIGAWASLQSEILESREALDKRMEEFSEKFRGGDVPRPEYWTGYRVVPSRIEFWQLRLNRLHDRLLYTREKDGSWRLERLFP